MGLDVKLIPKIFAQQSFIKTRNPTGVPKKEILSMAIANHLGKR